MMNETQPPEAIQEKVHAGTGSTHHFRQSGLAYLGNHGVGSPFAELSQWQKSSCWRFSLELNSWSIKSCSYRMFLASK
jgi:hypothetical protein